MNLFNRIKFASAVFDNNPEAQKLFKSGQLKLASEIDQPAKRPDVDTMEAINAFMKRNPVEKSYTPAAAKAVSSPKLNPQAALRSLKWPRSFKML